jgi:hypothetical protein
MRWSRRLAALFRSPRPEGDPPVEVEERITQMRSAVERVTAVIARVDAQFPGTDFVTSVTGVDGHLTLTWLEGPSENEVREAAQLGPTDQLDRAPSLSRLMTLVVHRWARADTSSFTYDDAKSLHALKVEPAAVELADLLMALAAADPACGDQMGMVGDRPTAGTLEWAKGYVAQVADSVSTAADLDPRKVSRNHLEDWWAWCTVLEQQFPDTDFDVLRGNPDGQVKTVRWVGGPTAQAVTDVSKDLVGAFLVRVPSAETMTRFALVHWLRGQDTRVRLTDITAFEGRRLDADVVELARLIGEVSRAPVLPTRAELFRWDDRLVAAESAVLTWVEATAAAAGMDIDVLAERARAAGTVGS